MSTPVNQWFATLGSRALGSRALQSRALQSARNLARFRLLMLLAAIVVVGSVTAQDAMSLPGSPAPRFFIVTDLDADAIELTEIDAVANDMITSTVYRPRFAEIEIFDASGNALDVETLRARLAIGSVVLVAADEHPVDPIYLGIIEDDTIVLVGVVVRVEVE